MIGKRKLDSSLKPLLALADRAFERYDLLVMTWGRRLTRFANSYIHQNMADSNLYVLLRGIRGDKVGISSVNSLSPDQLERLVERTRHLVNIAKPQPHVELVPDGAEKLPEDTGFDAATSKLAPQDMVDRVKILFDEAAKKKVRAFGSFEVSAGEVMYRNSLGLHRYHKATKASLNSTPLSEDSAGHAEAHARRVDDIDFREIAKRSIDVCLRARNPISTKPGRYDVILPPQAVSNLTCFLAWIAFGARTYQEGTSCLNGKLGTRIANPLVTLRDDAHDVAGLPMPFDFEGVKREKVELISKGMAGGLVYDLRTARHDGVASTGHARPADSGSGPIPTHLFMDAGTTPVAKMIAGTKRGLLITYFNYVNTVNPMETTLTGMTRNGTFLVENGEVTRPVKNLRFTQSILEALSSVESVSRERELEAGWFGGTVMPWLKIRDFNFTSATEF